MIALASSTFGQPRKDPEVERLIDQLVQVDSPEHDVDPYRWGGRFMAVDCPRIRAEENAASFPVNRAMRKLVRMGLRALPGLLSHLTDSRPTKAIEDGKHFDGRIFTTTYRSWRDTTVRTLEEFSPQEDYPHEEEVRGPYTFKVGDICFFLVGQIVDWPCWPQEYVPTNFEIIQSPVRDPSIAAAVKKDWEEMTSKSFLKWLRKLFAKGETSAIMRLCLYYPHEGFKVGLARLRRYFQLQAADIPQKTCDYVEALVSCGGKRFDQPIQALFEKALTLKKHMNDEQLFYMDFLAQSCARQMIHKGHDADYRAYFMERLALIPVKTDNPNYIEKRLVFAAWVKALGSRSGTAPIWRYE